MPEDAALLWLDECKTMDNQHSLVLDAMLANAAAVPAQAESVMDQVMPAPAQPAAAAAAVPDRYKLWAAPLLEALSPVIKRRGKQVARPLIGSACSCSGSEFKALEKVNIEADFYWFCDKESQSFNFIRENGPAHEHFFIDFEEVAKTGSGFCAIHKEVCSADPPPHKRKAFRSLVAGTSCRGYSTANFHRPEGTTTHPESQLVPAWCKEVKRGDWDEGWLENVFGLGKRENKKNPVSPLQLLADTVTEELCEYHLQIYFVDGGDCNCLTRRRIWIHVLHNRHGGAATHAKMNNYIKAGSSSSSNSSSSSRRFSWLQQCYS